jgi:hypothetical protein
MLRLNLPVDCEMGVVCFIQRYVDQDAGAGSTDYQCKNMSYDDHRGTDSRVRYYVDIRRGFAVIAAAPGIVSAIRDSMSDISVRDVGIAALLGNIPVKASLSTMATAGKPNTIICKMAASKLNLAIKSNEVIGLR